jgi:phage replication-related protein YjqB (UPF0714/DUF867 family)
VLSELLARRDVTEELALRSRFGFMAFHGGTLEKATDAIAREAARRADASYYGVVQTAAEPVHIPSTEVRPAHSDSLSRFLAHVDVVVTVHGYGRKQLMRTVLLGGRNRELADHVASHARAALPDYSFRTDLDSMPKGLAGQHRHNPVNFPPQRGLQIELPPAMRWHHDKKGWSEDDGIGRAPQVDTFIAVLARSAAIWMDSARQNRHNLRERPPQE